MSGTPHFSTHTTTTNRPPRRKDARSTAALGNADTLPTVDRLAATDKKKVTRRCLSHQI